MTIIGITGTLGAGKGTIVEYLKEARGFLHFSVRGYLREEIRRRGLPDNRDSMFLLANQLRAEHGPSFVTDELCREAAKAGRPSIIESIRTTGEIASLRKQEGFILLAVDASPEIRYRRIVERASETDRVSYDTFLANEARESVSENPGVQNLRACIRQADRIFFNNGTREELYNHIEKFLQETENKT